ncbi:MAG: hypothetical protein WCS78_04270 [Bacilli bacterium]
MNIKFKEKNFAEEHSININQYKIKNVTFRPNKTVAIALIIICIIIILISGICYITDGNYSINVKVMFIIFNTLMFFIMLFALLTFRVKIIYNVDILKMIGILHIKEIPISTIKYYFLVNNWKNGGMNVYIFYNDNYINYYTFDTNSSNFIILLNFTKLGIPQLDDESFYAIKKSVKRKIR